MGKSLRVAYGEALVKLGQKNDKIVALDADLAHATMSATFAEAFPDRFFNAGIAECNMMGMAALLIQDTFHLQAHLLFSEQEELMRSFVTLLHTQTQMLNLDYLIQDFQ